MVSGGVPWCSLVSVGSSGVLWCPVVFGGVPLCLVRSIRRSTVISIVRSILRSIVGANGIDSES